MGSFWNEFLGAENRLNGICPYFTMFPLTFPLTRLLRAQRGHQVLDPFCGRGTTNFAARLLGLASVGIDSNPVAVSIASAKFVAPSVENVVRLCADVLRLRKTPVDIPTGSFWRWAFDPKTLIAVCKLREFFCRECETEEAIALRAIVLGALHGPRTKGVPSYLSNQMPRTYATKPDPAVRFWQSRNLKPHYVDTFDVITQRAIRFFTNTPAKKPGSVIQADARTVDLSCFQYFDWVITSPPYIGMRTYFPDQWLRSWFLGGPSHVVYSGPPQIGKENPARFGSDLAKVWRNIAVQCNPCATLIVRFGALPSIQVDARALLKKTLHDAQCGWRIVTIKAAGTAREGKRQSDQFFSRASLPFSEFDLYARLEK
jgi:SAM-dependent methyltransferase